MKTIYFGNLSWHHQCPSTSEPHFHGMPRLQVWEAPSLQYGERRAALSSSLHLCSYPCLGISQAGRADFHALLLYYACISDCKKMKTCHPLSVLSQRHQSVTFTYLGFTSSSSCFSVGFDAGKMPVFPQIDHYIHLFLTYTMNFNGRIHFIVSFPPH